VLAPPVAGTTPTVVALAPTMAATGAGLIGAPAGLPFAVVAGGMRMPGVQVAEVQPVQMPQLAETEQLAQAERPALPVASQVQPAPYVAPVYPRKQDRN